MSLFNYKLIHAISLIFPNDKAALSYCPDLLVYQHNAEQYHLTWQALIKANYIYTNGYKLKSVSFIQYAFEMIKGWLGFFNYCKPSHVQLSLCKFAYYGYLQGYSQEHLSSLIHLASMLIRKARNIVK